VVVLLVWQALRGEPVTRPGATTLAAAAVLLLAGVAAAAVTMGAGRRDAPALREHMDQMHRSRRS
jgi:hypothetical protein